MLRPARELRTAPSPRLRGGEYKITNGNLGSRKGEGVQRWERLKTGGDRDAYNQLRASLKNPTDRRHSHGRPFLLLMYLCPIYASHVPVDQLLQKYNPREGGYATVLI
jgi:hypothetical protein